MKSTDVPFMLQQTLFIVFNVSLQYVIIFALLYGWLSPTTAKVRVARRPAVQHTLCIQLTEELFAG